MPVKTPSVVHSRKRGRTAMPKKKYESDKKYDIKYKSERTKQVGVRFFPADMELYEFIQKQPNKSGYIKDLIRADMEKHQQ